MQFKIEVTTGDLEKIVGTDEDLMIKIKKAALAEFSRRHFAGMINANSLIPFRDQIVSMIRAEVAAQTEAIKSEDVFDRTTGQYVRTSIEKKVANMIVKAIDKYVDEMASVRVESILQRVNRTIAETVDSKINDFISGETRRILEEKKDQALMEVQKIMAAVRADQIRGDRTA
jgi:hypothetical protein